ncbi:hypothetical protein GLOIN_2v1786147 [Rhizophagus irregularis DAOM 181602=DAOM 197198]|nr:hypothetical protein GLOIN_2v1786147 [Rhizophagus irregularis DAOM 181602=DAOM 197198]
MEKFFPDLCQSCSLGFFGPRRSENLNDAHEHLIEILKLIKTNYGEVSITPNLHLSLHLNKCCKDYGPLYSFWYFSFERMNGILGSLPNSRRKIEPEIMRFMMQSSQIERRFNTLALNHQAIFQILDLNDDTTDDNENESLESEELQAFLDISEKLVSGGATGTEEYPGELLSPIKLNVILPDDILDLLVDYYNHAYEEYNFSRPRLDPSSSTENYIAVTGNITQCGRLRISAEYFGSILSKSEDSDDFTNDPELWKKEFFNSSVNSIIPVHHILGRFVPAKFKYKRTEYLAILPLNRKFHI